MFALRPWKDLNLGEGLCPPCLKAAQVAYCKARTINWHQLETYFGLCDLEDREALSSDFDSSQ